MIRDLTTDDVDEMVALGAVMHEESPLAKYHFNQDRAVYILNEIIGKEVVFAAGAFVDGRLAGILVAELTTHLFVDIKIVSDIVFYVSPDRRGAVAGKRLVDRFKAWGLDVDADITRIQVDAGIDNGRACAFLGHLGFEDKGTSMMIGI